MNINITDEDREIARLLEQQDEPPEDPIFGKVIHTYTRKQALEDGFQVDVSETAREAGINWPVFLNRSVWDAYVEVPKGVRGQDEKGRLWDVVWMLKFGMRAVPPTVQSGFRFSYQLHVRCDNRERTPPLRTLDVLVGAVDIDDPSPSLTVVMPGED